MITKKTSLINKYFKMISNLKLLSNIPTFSDFEETVDILFYFQLKKFL